MKNIHVLPTDKESRLHFWTNDKGLRATLYGQPQLEIPNTGKNICITNNEKIKEGDWCMSLCDDESYEEIYQCKDVSLVDKEDKKIILTTDPKLIADGVQAIDDEFLEWFVMNPSCDYVEVQKIAYPSNKGFLEKKPLIIENIYKIIIPKKEPKQYPNGGYAPGNYMCNCSTCKTKFQGDKRAVQCETCAIKIVEQQAQSIIENNRKIEEQKELSTKLHKGEVVDELYPKEFKQDALNHFLSTSSVIVKDPQKWDFNKQETMSEAIKQVINNKIMSRKDEIAVLIEYLENDVILTSNLYKSLLSDTIIKNGKLIEAYKIELEELKNK
jgi:hypothetical protein